MDSLLYKKSASLWLPKSISRIHYAPLFINVVHFRMHVLIEQKKVLKYQICVMIKIRAREEMIFSL